MSKDAKYVVRLGVEEREQLQASQLGGSYGEFPEFLTTERRSLIRNSGTF